MTELQVRPASTTKRPSVSYVHHVSFRVDDLDDALDFYERLLGCTRLERPELGVQGAWLLAGDVQVHLIETDVDETFGSAPTVPNPSANHVAFHVDDLEQFASHLEGEGLRPVRGVIPGVHQLFVQDPAGNVIEFTPATRGGSPS